MQRGETCPTCTGDVLTCLACGVNGVGIGFEHECDPLAAKTERSRVVKWLRETGRYDNPWNLGDVADAIERGEHLSGPKA